MHHGVVAVSAALDDRRGDDDADASAAVAPAPRSRDRREGGAVGRARAACPTGPCWPERPRGERCPRGAPGEPTSDLPPIGLLGGDLCRTLGGRGDEARLRGEEVTLAPVDVGEVLLDGRVRFFVAHVVVRKGGGGGPVVAAMNAQYLGRWDVAPRGHPGDGILEVVEVDAGDGGRAAVEGVAAPPGRHARAPPLDHRPAGAGRPARRRRPRRLDRRRAAARPAP